MPPVTKGRLNVSSNEPVKMSTSPLLLLSMMLTIVFCQERIDEYEHQHDAQRHKEAVGDQYETTTDKEHQQDAFPIDICLHTKCKFTLFLSV